MSLVKFLFKKVAKNRVLKEFVEKSVEHYSRDENIPRSDWDTIWSTYVLDMFLLSKFSKDPRNETSSVNDRLFNQISDLSGVKKFIVTDIFLTALDQTPSKFQDMTVTYSDKKVTIGGIEIDNPTDTDNLEQLLRYESISGYKHTGNTRVNISGAINLCVNTLELPGCGFFKDDVNTLGIPFDYVKSLQQEQTLVLYAPTSLSYSKIVVDELDSYLDRFPSAMVFVLTMHQNLRSRKLKINRYNGMIVMTSKSVLGKPEEYIEGRNVEFPWSSNSMPSFTEMFSRLQYIANNTDEYMSWSVRKRQYNLGVVERTYPKDYYETDSLADIHAEPVRITCNEEGSKSPLEAWNELLISDARIINKSVKDQREAVYLKERGCNLFNAAYATYALSRFVGKGAKILDPASGWGERAIASWACDCSEYRGWDTNPALQDVYKQQMEASGLTLNSKVKLGPFEDDIAMFDSGYAGYFDACITSPPFFTQEIYTGEMTSTERYKEFASWVNNFYIPLLKACYKGLRYGGFLMAYIPAFRKTGNKPETTLEQVMKRISTPDKKTKGYKSYLSDMKLIADIIMKEQGAVYEGILGFSMYNTLENKKGNVREMFFWSKPYRVHKHLKMPVSIQSQTLDYSNFHGGIFELGIDYFKTIKTDVYVIVDYPSFDIESICYACLVHKLKCFVVAETQPEVQFYAARFIPKKDYVKPVNALVLEQGCNIPELLKIVASKIEVKEKPIRIWACDTPGVRALLPMVFPDTLVNMITSRNVKVAEKNFTYVYVPGIRDDRMLPLFSQRKDTRDWMLINKK